MNFEANLIKGWPPLAWLARCEQNNPTIYLDHGAKVEVAQDRFFEAVWPGSYTDGDIDRTDIVSGSGARIRPEGAVFVTSSAVVDRLQYVRLGGTVWVSNSLPCLLKSTQSKIDWKYKNLYSDLISISNGADRYVQSLPASNGPIELVYFDNIRWDGRNIERIAKPVVERRLETFSDYHSFLDENMRAIAQNMTSPARQHSYTMLGTLSTGYDSRPSWPSPAITVARRPSA